MVALDSRPLLYIVEAQVESSTSFRLRIQKTTFYYEDGGAYGLAIVLPWSCLACNVTSDLFSD